MRSHILNGLHKANHGGMFFRLCPRRDQTLRQIECRPNIITASFLKQVHNVATKFCHEAAVGSLVCGQTRQLFRQEWIRATNLF